MLNYVLQKKNKKTIETNVDHLNLSKFDLEYDVDPLFKKNSARFDEGRNGGVNFLTSLILKVSSYFVFEFLKYCIDLLT